MPPVDSIFRPFRPSDAERSDRAAGDRLRHREKVRQAIRENIADIIAEESIIGKDRDRIIKVPIRGIKEYRFIYGNDAPGVGPGQRPVAARPGRRPARGRRRRASRTAPATGPASTTTRPTSRLDELIDLMFEDLELPDLERKRLREIPSERIAKRKGYRQVGIRHAPRQAAHRRARKRASATLADARARERRTAPSDADAASASRSTTTT